MRNRAKCKLCSTIIESFHSGDYIDCKCGEISVYGGEALQCAAKDWNNFLRIDDKDNEILVTVKEENINRELIQPITTTKDLLNTLEEMIKNIENLPQHAMTSPITHYDHCASLMVLLALFRSVCKDRI